MLTFDGDLVEIATQAHTQRRVSASNAHRTRRPASVARPSASTATMASCCPTFFKSIAGTRSRSISGSATRPAMPQPVVVLQRTRGTDVGFNGFDVMLADGILEARLYRVWPGNALRRSGDRTDSAGRVAACDRHLRRFEPCGRACSCTSTARKCRTKIAPRSHSQVCIAAIGRGNGHLTLGERFRDRGFKDGEVDELRIVQARAGAARSSAIARRQGAGERSLAEPESHREPTPRLLFLGHRRQKSASRRATLREARKQLVEAEEPIQEIPVMEELAEPRPTYILARGRVRCAEDGRESRRARHVRKHARRRSRPMRRAIGLGLAQWLTDPDHPLTARVFVNRVWANFFGRGLVATPENFGRQGALPTHPELLDWLARDFVDHGWDVKRLCRQIVLSATYRQDSRLRPELAERDPENLLLARGPSRRLSAEADSRRRARRVRTAGAGNWAARRSRRTSRAKICGANRTRCRRPTSSRPASRSTAARSTPCGSGPRRCRT